MSLKDVKGWVSDREDVSLYLSIFSGARMVISSIRVRLVSCRAVSCRIGCVYVGVFVVFWRRFGLCFDVNCAGGGGGAGGSPRLWRGVSTYSRDISSDLKHYCTAFVCLCLFKGKGGGVHDEHTTHYYYCKQEVPRASAMQTPPGTRKAKSTMPWLKLDADRVGWDEMKM